MTADPEERLAGMGDGGAASGSEAVGEEVCSSERAKVIKGYATTPANGSARAWGLCGAHLF